MDLPALQERLAQAGSDFADIAKAEAFFWFVESESGVVGNVTLQNINRMMLTAEVGYGTFAAARKNGVATAAVRELVRQVFAQTPLRKLIAFVHEQNVASVKVLERVGFRQEGLLREHYIVNGQPTNERIFGLLRQDL